MEGSASRNESGIAPGKRGFAVTAKRERHGRACVAPYVPPSLKRPAHLLSFFRAVLPDRQVSRGGHLPGGRDGKLAISRAAARCARNERARRAATSTRFVSGAEAGIGACRGKPYGGPDTVHNATLSDHMARTWFLLVKTLESQGH